MKKKQVLALAVAALVVLPILLSGCTYKKNKHDTRQHIYTIGAVFTNDLENVFDELYVYSSDTDEMGPDFIRNTGGITKVGSYGVTVEESEAYNVWIRDEDGGVYTFSPVQLDNGDLAVIDYDEELILTVTHRTGGSDSITGRYIAPGDAPDQAYSPLKKQVEYKFKVKNESPKSTIVYIAMREAAAQSKGEVELFLDELEPNKTANIIGKLYEEDKDITEWVLTIKTSDGESFTSKTPFDPWSTEEIIITQSGDNLNFKIL